MHSYPESELKFQTFPPVAEQQDMIAFFKRV